uniref:Uncharacterized protein n=1 Tax=Anguilla anguilla TaxID=7936 RepID=A0A0E9X6Z7_ANGAN
MLYRCSPTPPLRMSLKCVHYNQLCSHSFSCPFFPEKPWMRNKVLKVDWFVHLTC